MENFQDVHIIIYDDYVNDVNMELLKVFNFLGVKNCMIDTAERHMVGGWQWKNIKMKALLLSNNKLKSLLKIVLPSQTLRIFIRKKIMKYTVIKTSKINKTTEKINNSTTKLSPIIEANQKCCLKAR